MKCMCGRWEKTEVDKCIWRLKPLKASSCHTSSVIIDGGRSGEVHWEANKDQEKQASVSLTKVCGHPNGT